MRSLTPLVCLGFGLQALLGIATLALAPDMVARSLHRGSRSIAITLLAGVLLFGSLNLIPGIALWTICMGSRWARAWAVAASILNLAWTPLVAQCTESGAVLLTLIGLFGLAGFLWPLRFRRRGSFAPGFPPFRVHFGPYQNGRARQIEPEQ